MTSYKRTRTAWKRMPRKDWRREAWRWRAHCRELEREHKVWYREVYQQQAGRQLGEESPL